MNQIQLIAAGQRWNATYTVENGGVCVASAYGGQRAPLAADQDPEAVALAVFEKIVKGWSPGTRRAAFRPGRPYAPQR